MSNWDISFKGYQNYHTLVKFPAEFKFLVRFSFGHATNREISKMSNKSKLKKVENWLKSALLSYNKNYPREIFFYDIYALLEKFEQKKFFFQWQTFWLFSLKNAPIRYINLNFPANWHRMGKIWLKIRIPHQILHRKPFFSFFQIWGII